MAPHIKERPEGNDVVLSKGPCTNTKCDTEYGNVTYADGHQHCFSCNHTVPPNGATHGLQEAKPPAGATGDLLKPNSKDEPFAPLQKRGLTSQTLLKFGYFKAGFKGQWVGVAPYFTKDGEPAGQKLRFPNKDFTVLKAQPDSPSIGECQLFGRHVFGDKYDRKVVVTEGEIDAMTVAQCLEFGIAVVSVNTGSKGAAKCLKENYLWLDRFAEIILWFDDDEPGQTAAMECAQLFKVGKVKLAKVPGYKDASDVLQANKPGDIKAAIFAAAAWRPKGIVNAASSPDDVLAPKPEDETTWSYLWPWDEANEKLGPMRPGQVCYHVAGTGIGKTTGMAEIEMCLLKQGCKIGHLGFEDTRRDVKLRLLSIHVSQRLDIEQLPDADMLKIHEEVFGTGLVELFDPETAEWTVDAILGYVRYCAKALDCRVLVVDPLTFIAAGLEVGDDERRALDKVSRDLAAMSKELDIHIQVTHHLSRPEGTAHEEGAATSLNQVRGSGGIANFASFVIGHERNQQAEGGQALVTQLRILKNRPRSITGPMVALSYDLDTGRLENQGECYEGPTKGVRRRGGSGFEPIRSTDY